MRVCVCACVRVCVRVSLSVRVRVRAFFGAYGTTKRDIGVYCQGRRQFNSYVCIA